MGTFVGLVLGAGLLLIWLACWSEPEQRPSHRRQSTNDRIRDLLAQAGMPTIAPAGLAAVSLGFGIVICLVNLGLTGAPTIAFCFAAMATAAPTLLVRARARTRRKQLRAVWPEVVDDLVSAIRAGLALPDALIGLATRGPEELRSDFRNFADDYRATGNFADALETLKARLADPVADRLVEALRITREVGGTDLVRLLRTLAQLLREDLRTRGEMEARQSWTVNGARLATAAPWIVLLLLSGRPETAAAFNSPAGAAVLLIGAAGSAAAYWLMLRLGRLPEEARVLR